ncbi:MAG: ABC transporter ATP-binding protein [Pseudomonadota bacterium]
MLDQGDCTLLTIEPQDTRQDTQPVSGRASTRQFGKLRRALHSRSKPADLSAERISYSAPNGSMLLREVTLTARAGDRLAIIGPNGAGKTTLLQVLSGRLRPASGRVLMAGQDLSLIEHGARARQIAVLAQSDQPDLRLRGTDYVAFGRIPHARTSPSDSHERAVSQALETTGATAFAHRKLMELSGGERQRLMLARALAQEPAILLLDEPTNNLDLRARADLIDIAAGLGITVIAVLHDLSLVPDFADRIAVLSEGRLVCCDTPEIALSDPIVRDVFDMSVLRFPHPHDGRPLLIFEKPQVKENSL